MITTLKSSMLDASTPKGDSRLHSEGNPPPYSFRLPTSLLHFVSPLSMPYVELFDD